MDVVNAARTKRAEKFAQKQAAELQMCLCEERMIALRQEILEVDRDLQDANDNVSVLQANFREAPPGVRGKFTNPMAIPDCSDIDTSEDFHSEHSAPRS